MAYTQLRSSNPDDWRGFYKRPDGTYGSKTGFPTEEAAQHWGEEQEALIQRHLWSDPRHAEVSFGLMAREWQEAVTPRLGRGTADKWACPVLTDRVDEV